MRPARLYSVGETVCRKRGLPLQKKIRSSADSLSPDEEVELDRRFARSSPCSSFLALLFSRFASFLSSSPCSRCLVSLSSSLFLRVVPLLLSQDSSLRPRCSSAVGCSLPSLRSNLSSSGTPLPLTTTRCSRGIASSSQLFCFCNQASADASSSFHQRIGRPLHSGDATFTRTMLRAQLRRSSLIRPPDQSIPFARKFRSILRFAGSRGQCDISQISLSQNGLMTVTAMKA